MKQTSANSGVSFKKYLVILLTILSFSFSQSVFAHSVDSYSGTCASGPQYKVTAVVSNVNSTSNYRWQWKNASNAWVCFVNGANIINGNTYDVTGAVYNLTTTPGPIVFTNPNSGLQGLEIRMVISDGNGVNPCTLPAGNTWTSTNNHFINISGSSCGANNLCPVGGINLGSLTNYLFVFTNGATDANWQSASKGFIGNVAVDGIQASERTSGSFAYAGTIYSNDASLNAWSSIVSNNSSQAFSSLNQASLLTSLETDLNNVFTQINALPVTAGYNGIAATALNGLNRQNSIAETFIININSGFSISSKINITGDANDVFILRWDTDMNFGNGYQGQVKFQSGGAIVPLGGLKPSNFISVAGDINASGGGANPPAPYPQGPRFNNGTGSLISGGADFSGGGFFTGYWFTTGDPVTGETAPLSNGIFVGGWYSKTTKFSMTSGTSGVYVAPVCGTPVCSGRVTSLYFNELNNGPDLPITNGATFTIAQLGSLYNLEAGTSGTIGSIKYTITGPTPTSNIENATPYNSPGTGSGAWTGAVGTYTVNLKTYSAADATGTLCHDTTITFNLTSNSVSLGNQVFIDRNDNGIYETVNGETGYDGAIVKVYADNNDDGIADGTALGTRTTSGGGFYNFTGLPAGKYFVQIESVPGWMFKSTVNGGDPDNDIDNDNNGLTQNTTTAIIKGGTIQLTVGGEPGGGNANNTYDFGFFKTNGLGDFVFLDTDADGIQDAGEVGIAGVTVQLRNTSGALLATTTTNSSGYYFFYEPAQYGTNNYNIQFVTPAGYTPSPANQGGDDSKDSDPIAGIITNVNVPNGTWNHTFDAGFTQTSTLGSIGDRVWLDANGNGIQDATETGGITGVVVQLRNSVGTVIATQNTNGTGNYLFTGLPAGTYTVAFPVSISGAVVTTQNVGTNDDIDSDPSQASGITGNIV
ncbi:MAG: SdrD B-like domain-containing protein, partial [Ferruginibacter sp.]